MFVKIRQRGTITLPRELRKDLDENTVLEAVRRDDGVIELRPQIVIDAARDRWWDEYWKPLEKEADEDVAAGRFQTYDDVESFLAALEKIPLPPPED